MAPRDGITRVESERTGKVTYRARVSWVGPDGRRHHRSKSHATKRAAEQWRRALLAELDRGEFFEPAPDTVAEVAARWLADIERSKAASTYRKYREVWAYTIEPRFGTRKMASLRSTEVQAWYEELGLTYAANTIAQIHKVLRGIATHAVTDGVIRVNPCDGRRLPKDTPDPPKAWTVDQARHFLAGVAVDDEAIPLVLMLATGLRIGEALALHWRDVDFKARTLRVTHTLQDTPDGVCVVEVTKTRSSRRTVALPAAAVLALRRQRDRVQGELVFTRPDGRRVGADRLRRRFRHYCETMKLPILTPHELRKTAVTLMLARGVPPEVVARQTGHSVEEMLRRYASVSSALQRMAADSLDAVLEIPDHRTSRM